MINLTLNSSLLRLALVRDSVSAESSIEEILL